MSSATRALNSLSDIQSTVQRMKREARAAGQVELEKKLRRLDSDLDDLEREIRSLKRDLD